MPILALKTVLKHTQIHMCIIFKYDYYIYTCLLYLHMCIIFTRGYSIYAYLFYLHVCIIITHVHYAHPCLLYLQTFITFWSHPTFQTYFISMRITRIMPKKIITWTAEFCTCCVIIMYVTNNPYTIYKTSGRSIISSCMPLLSRK